MAFTTINKSTDFFKPKIYTGNGSTQSITGVGFQPDLNWIKSRSANENHNIVDAVRGDSGANTGYYYLSSNSSAAQASGTGNTLVSSLDADGFSIGNNDVVNTNSGGYVSWNWKANGAGSSNEDGSITSTVSANTTAGFSIVKYTGTGSADTIGHGLGAVPKMIISKRLDTTSYWITYHEAIGNDKELYLNDTSAASPAANTWNSTTPTSSVWSVATDSNNTSGGSFISYCFADIKGYSKMGYFEGNLDADGPFVYTGFKPQFILLKNADNSASGDEWFMEDAARSTYNPTGRKVSANLNNSETGYSSPSSWVDIDFLSNGFKIRTSDAGFNEHTMIYMCFGQTLVGTNNIPGIAR